MRHETPICMAKPPAHAPFVLADLRFAPGQFRRRAVKESERPVGISGVDRDGQRVENLANATVCFERKSQRALGTTDLVKKADRTFDPVVGLQYLNIDKSGCTRALW